MLSHTIDMLDDQMTTQAHQHIDIPIANASDSDIGTAEGLPSETGIVASGTGPMDGLTQPTQQRGEIGRDALGDNARRSATEEDVALCDVASALTTRPQAMPRNLGVAVAMALLAIGGILAWQVIGSRNNDAKTKFDEVARQLDSLIPPATEHNAAAATTFNDVARQLDSLTPPATEHNAAAATTFAEVGRVLDSLIPPATKHNAADAAAAAQAESTSAASRQDLLTVGANLLKEIQQMRERWVDRTDKTIGTLKAHREMFSVVLTEAQSDVLQEYINTFERLHAEGMAQFAAIENGSLEPTTIRIRLQRLKQLDQEWKETGKEFARQGREVGLK